jgi:chromate transporter
LVPRIRQSKIAAAALDGLNAGSLALMAVVTLQLATSAVVDIPTAMIGVAAAVAIFVFKMNSAWLVAGAAIAGLIAAGLT